MVQELAAPSGVVKSHLSPSAIGDVPGEEPDEFDGGKVLGKVRDFGELRRNIGHQADINSPHIPAQSSIGIG